MRITQSRRYVDACRKGLASYYENFLQKMECYGTPHDTYKASDSEGILGFIRAAADLHRFTQESIFAKYLQAGFEYEFSFKFGYNVPVQLDPLKKVGWHSSGGSITSVSNPHVHPMSSSVLDELLYLSEIHPQNSYIASRLMDTLGWTLQCHNRFEGEYDFGRTGWMSERFCYSEALTTERYRDGSPSSVWFCYLPWGAANFLEGLTGDLWKRWEKILGWHEGNGLASKSSK